MVNLRRKGTEHGDNCDNWQEEIGHVEIPFRGVHQHLERVVADRKKAEWLKWFYYYMGFRARKI